MNRFAVPRLAAPALALAILLPGCGRDLAVPPRNTLLLPEPYPSVAPYEQRVISVSGGAPPYAYRIADGGNGSLGATVAVRDATSATYAAGPRGPALDVVEVRDSGGAVALARVSVGPNLTVSPTNAFVGPGGRVSFAVSGGKGPWTLNVISATTSQGDVIGTDFLATPSGGCSGVVSEPGTVSLLLTDHTASPGIPIQLTVGRGLDLFPAAGTGLVAPHEQIALVASGGQPPYAYSMATAGSNQPTVDAGRGTYRAGPTGNVVDRVRVTDANQQEACFDVTVGAELQAVLAASDVRPGHPMQILASGGRPPYAYGFPFKGNRSRGSIDPVIGTYLPGFNAAARDLLQVTDATGLASFTLPPVLVGPVPVDAVGTLGGGCATGDVDGDGRKDVMTWSAVGELRVGVSAHGTGGPTVTTYAPAFVNGSSGGIVLDLDQDGQSDFLYASYDGSLAAMVGQRSGQLVTSRFLHLGSSIYRLASSPSSVAPFSSRVFASIMSDGTVCPSGGATPYGLVAVDFDSVSKAFKAPICLGSLPSPAFAMAAADFNGDGWPDLAYLYSNLSGNRVYQRLSATASTFAAEKFVSLPAGWYAFQFDGEFVNPMVTIQSLTSTTSDLVLAAVDTPSFQTSYRTAAAVLAGGSTGLAYARLDVLQPGGANLKGMAAIGAGRRPQLVTWSGADGRAPTYDYPFPAAAASPPVLAAAQPAPRAYRVGCVASGDLNGDFVEDLVIAPRDPGSAADELLGDTDGTWGLHPHYAFASPFVPSPAGDPDLDGVSDYILPAGDVDGDGRVDLIGPSAGQGFEVLFYTDGELSVGPSTATPGEFLRATARDFDGDGITDVMARVGPGDVYFYKGLAPGRGQFEAPVKVELVDPAGNPTSVAGIFLFPVELGGTSPGPDLAGYTLVGSAYAYVTMIFDTPTHAVVGVGELTDANYAVYPDLDGDGIADVVHRDGLDQLFAALVKPGDATAGNPIWPFRPFSAVLDTTFTHFAGIVDVPGTRRQRAVVVNSTEVMLVEAPGGVISVEHRPFAGGAVYSSTKPVVADVNGDGLPDLILESRPPEPWHVLLGTADGKFQLGPTPALDFNPGLKTYFYSVPSPAGLADLVLVLNSSYLVYRNDGTGHFH